MDSIPKTKVQHPFAMKWPIEETVLREWKENKPGKFLSSGWFSYSNDSDIEYAVYIYPHGGVEEGTEEETWIGLNFHRKNTSFLTVKADYNISIRTANYDADMIQAADSDKCCIATKDFFDPEKKFIVDEKVFIEFEGVLSYETEMPAVDEPIFNSSDTLCLDLWKQEDNKDFTIVVDKKEITAHKCVLVARSSVFRAMFQSGMKEAKENKVFIKDFDFNIVEAAIKSCYHQSLVEYTSLEDKLNFLQFYDKYDIQSLKDPLEIYLMSVINEFTVCRITNAALLSNVPKLETKCAEFLQTCLDEKHPVTNFDLLDKDFVFNLVKNSLFRVLSCDL
uniref:BTB domain-containing protein n=1 Tax=Panagrolaimus sp. ES5 TaxID=591445 RepID=A0AC34FYU9_9BILA